MAVRVIKDGITIVHDLLENAGSVKVNKATVMKTGLLVVNNRARLCEAIQAAVKLGVDARMAAQEAILVVYAMSNAVCVVDGQNALFQNMFDLDDKAMWPLYDLTATARGDARRSFLRVAAVAQAIGLKGHSSHETKQYYKLLLPRDVNDQRIYATITPATSRAPDQFLGLSVCNPQTARDFIKGTVASSMQHAIAPYILMVDAMRSVLEKLSLAFLIDVLTSNAMSDDDAKKRLKAVATTPWSAEGEAALGCALGGVLTASELQLRRQAIESVPLSAKFGLRVVPVSPSQRRAHLAQSESPRLLAAVAYGDSEQNMQSVPVGHMVIPLSSPGVVATQ